MSDGMKRLTYNIIFIFGMVAGQIFEWWLIIVVVVLAAVRAIYDIWREIREEET